MSLLLLLLGGYFGRSGGSSESFLLVLVDVFIMNLYAFRQRRRARTSPNPRQ